MNEIFTRRSVRKYADKPVEKEKVEKLLRPGLCKHQVPPTNNLGNLSLLTIKSF